MTVHENKYLEMLKADSAQKHIPDEKPFSPPLDADGVPCGLCPSCHRGEFWRWPKSNPKHDPRGWTCWFCNHPPVGSGPCDFCGVPEK